MTPLRDVWDGLTPIHDQLLGLLFTLIGVFLIWLFRARVKLIFGRANNSLNHVLLPNPEDEKNPEQIEVYVEKFFLQNMGRAPAHDVEFILSDWPTDVRVWQPRDVQFKRVDRGNCMICIPRIAPRELVIIDCVYLNKKAGFITSVKCAEVLGKEVQFNTFRQMPNWFNVSAVVLLVLGVAFLVQVLVAYLAA